MKKSLVTMIYLTLLGYIFVAFAFYSSHFKNMPWYEPSQMNIEIGLGFMKLLLPIILVAYLIIFLFRGYFKSSFLILLFTIIFINLPALFLKTINIRAVEYSGTILCLLFFILNVVAYIFYLIRK